MFLNTNFDRWGKLVRKFSWIVLLGLRPTAIKGRIVGQRVLINSIPKSGTNLIEEALHYFPYMRGKVQRTLLPSMDESFTNMKVGQIKRGQCVPAHLYFSDSLIDVLKSNNTKVIFIVRDLRDSLLSHINYLEKIDFTHSHAKIFHKCSNLDDKLEIYLHGTNGFQAWSDFIRQYRGWMSPNSNVLVVRFEDLIDVKNRPDLCAKTVREIANFLEIKNVNAEYIIAKMINENGLTYNSPGINKWKKAFTKEQIDTINKNLSEELKFFGYSDGSEMLGAG